MTIPQGNKIIILPFVFALLVWGTAGATISAAVSSKADERVPFVPLEQPEEESEEESLSEIDPTFESQASYILGFGGLFGRSTWRLRIQSHESRIRVPVMHQPDASRAPPSSKR